MRPIPTLELERHLVATGHRLVAGMDEVGRGAIAGPLAVGVVVVSAVTGDPPTGLADSKLLTAQSRTALAPLVKGWAHSWALGWSSAGEIDRHGLTEALRRAGHRALDALAEPPDCIVIDGKYDWLTMPTTLFAQAAPAPWTVRVVVKADQRHAAVAAASVLAKVARDELMVQLADAHAVYGWASNKGYGSAEHMAALRVHGFSDQHRRSWALPSPGVRG